ncbi:MAG: 1-deoxy-D-xylulose-5-phosphate synthase [Phycisphaerales bacterium]
MTLLESIKTPADLRALPVERLPEVAADIRHAIIEQVKRSGGHLAPNLGVVELSIALHYTFDFASDRLLFDVGHQCYPHKLLTGRLPLLSGLRTSDGISGFPEPTESPYDLFRVGHAGTSISTAVGLARGDTLRGEGYDPGATPDGRRIVTLIGDASIVNGVAMEGLNNAGTLKRQFLVILNDNGMSISRPQGAMADTFDRMRLSRSYTGFKKQAKRILDQLPGGSLLEEAYHRAGEATKQWLPEAGERSWFEHFGLLAVGPIDGHDLPEMIEFFREARDFDRPMVLHVKTIKGKGFEPSEGDAQAFHSPAPFDVNGCRVEIRKKGRSFTSAFADALTDLMADDESVVACTAAMPDGTGVAKAMTEFPERTWDTGICESHAMDMMAGLAKSGLKPFFAVYSTFPQRAFDQAFQEVALQGLPVRLCLDRAGLVGGDGAVHHGFCDVSLLRTLPDAAITAAIDEPSLRAALAFMGAYDRGLSSVRYPRDAVRERFAGEPCPPFELGKARLLFVNAPGLDPERDTPECAVLAFGTPALDAVQAAEGLAGECRVAVYDARFAKPVDRDLVASLLARRVPIVTVEDHALAGGFGAAVVEAAADMGLDASRVVRLGIPDRWIIQDPRARQLAEAGLDARGISRAILRACDRDLEVDESGAPIGAGRRAAGA